MLLNCGVGKGFWESLGLQGDQTSQSKEMSPEYSLQGQMLTLKLQYFGHPMQRTDSLQKTLMLGKIEGRRRRGREDEMVGWHHWLNGHEFEQTPEDSEGEGSLVHFSPSGCKELDTAELLNWTECSFSSIKLTSNRMTGVSIRKENWGHMDTHSGRQCEDRQWLEWRAHMPRKNHVLWKPKKLEETGKGSSLVLWKGAWSCLYLDFRHLP